MYANVQCALYSIMYALAGLSEPGGRGAISQPYLNQGGGADYAQHITTISPEFLDLPKALSPHASKLAPRVGRGIPRTEAVRNSINCGDIISYYTIFS